MAPTLTNTTAHVNSLADITFDAVDAATTSSSKDVRIIYPTAATDFRVTTAVIPAGSKFHPGAHWHEDYAEVMRVIKGRVRMRVGREWRVITAEDGEVVVEKGVVHDFMRADAVATGGEVDEEDVVIQERSDPSDGAKELFFRHIFSLSTDSALFGYKVPLQMLLTLFYSDAYMEFVPVLGSANWYITHGVYSGIVVPLAWVAGLRPFYDEYTPERLSRVKKALEEGRGVAKKDV